MRRIIDLNENDLKRIVKKVLNERKNILNEQAYNSVAKLFQRCKTGDHGKEVMTRAQHRGIAQDIYDAINYEVLLVPGTDDPKLKSAFSSIKSIADLCGVAREFENFGYGDLLDEVDGDVDDNEDWTTYVRVPLQKAVDFEDKRQPEKPNNTVESKYTNDATGYQKFVMDKYTGAKYGPTGSYVWEDGSPLYKDSSGNWQEASFVDGTFKLN